MLIYRTIYFQMNHVQNGCAVYSVLFLWNRPKRQLRAHWITFTHVLCVYNFQSLSTSDLFQFVALVFAWFEICMSNFPRTAMMQPFNFSAFHEVKLFRTMEIVLKRHETRKKKCGWITIKSQKMWNCTRNVHMKCAHICLTKRNIYITVPRTRFSQIIIVFTFHCSLTVEWRA